MIFRFKRVHWLSIAKIWAERFRSFWKLRKIGNYFMPFNDSTQLCNAMRYFWCFVIIWYHFEKKQVIFADYPAHLDMNVLINWFNSYMSFKMHLTPRYTNLICGIYQKPITKRVFFTIKIEYRTLWKTWPKIPAFLCCVCVVSYGTAVNKNRLYVAEAHSNLISVSYRE